MIARACVHWNQGAFTAIEKNRLTLQQEAVFRPLELVAGVIVVLNGGGVVGLALVHTIAWWLQASSGFWVVRKHVRFEMHLLSRRQIIAILRNGLPIGFAAAVAIWLQQGPLIVAKQSLLFSPDDIGQLAVAMQAFFIILVLPTAIGMAALPAVSRSVLRGDGNDTLFAAGVTIAGWLLGTIGGLCGLAIGPGIVTALLGPEYRLAGELLGLTPWLIIPITIAITCRQVLIAHEDYLVPLVGVVTGLAIFGVVLVPCISTFGIYGPVVAAGIGMVAWAVVLVAALMRRTGFDLAGCVALPGLVCGGAAGTYLVLADYSVAIALGVATLILVAGFAWLACRYKVLREGLSPGER